MKERTRQAIEDVSIETSKNSVENINNKTNDIIRF